jgi:spermidine synthase
VLPAADEDLIAIERNFYGTITVSKMGDEEDDPYNAGKALYNGRIWHGFQFTDPSRELEASTYYVTGTGAALAVQENPRRDQGLRVAVIGLGSGSMAAHARAGDVFKFYEIDPKVLKVANEHFTYLKKSPARPEVVMGDARLSLDREPDQNYDVIHLDAFSGDAIPAHLLTDEAFALYERHLIKDEETKKPIGIVVVHISNRYLDLEPVVAAIARKYDYDTLSVHKTEEGGPTDTASDWVLVTKNKDFLNKLRDRGIGEPLKPKTELLWTDQFTALYPIMK